MKDYKLLLSDLAVALRRLHKALLDVEADSFGPVARPLQLLDLAINHEHFAWLRHLSELMVEIDERRDADEPVNADEAAAFRGAIETLVGPRSATVYDFRNRYMDVLQKAPAVAMAHGDLRRLLDRLPDRPPSQTTRDEGAP